MERQRRTAIEKAGAQLDGAFARWPALQRKRLALAIYRLAPALQTYLSDTDFGALFSPEIHKALWRAFLALCVRGATGGKDGIVEGVGEFVGAMPRVRKFFEIAVAAAMNPAAHLSELSQKMEKGPALSAAPRAPDEPSNPAAPDHRPEATPARTGSALP